LFASLLTSSVWDTDIETRVVWITLLALKDQDGFARVATVEGLARLARVSVEGARKAVEILTSPDPESSDPEHDGRRIERAPGGWVVLNAKKYDDLGSEQHRRETVRVNVANYRARKREQAECNQSVITGNHALSHTDTDIDTDIDIEEEGGTRAPAHEAVSETPAPPPRTESNPEGKRRAAAASLRTDGVDLNTPTTPDSIIETHIATCIPPDWRDAWREHVKLWRQAVPGDRRPEKLAWHQNYFRRIRAHCEESAPPGEEQALLVAVSKTFFAHGAAHKRFGAEIRASGYDAGHWLSWSKTGHWDSVSADDPETDHATFYDPETKCSYSRAAFEKLLAARKNGNTPTPKRKVEPIGVSPKGRAKVLAAMQQLAAGKGLPS